MSDLFAVLLARAAAGDPEAAARVDAWRRVTARAADRFERAARDRALRMTRNH